MGAELEPTKSEILAYHTEIPVKIMGCEISTKQSTTWLGTSINFKNENHLSFGLPDKKKFSLLNSAKVVRSYILDI